MKKSDGIKKLSKFPPSANDNFSLFKFENLKIKAVVFDIGGVLQLYKESSHEKSGASKGIHETLAKKFGKDLDSWFDAIDTPYGESMVGGISRKKAVSTISKNLGISGDKLERVYIKTIKRFFKKNKKLYKMAFRLKKKGYIIGILSDQWYLSQDALMPSRDIKGFDEIIVSCDSKVKMRKPSLEIYKLLIKKLGLKAEEILFIDNREYNLKPAKKLGIKTILFKDNDKVIKKLGGLLK